jgi:hypothetical protein
LVAGRGACRHAKVLVPTCHWRDASVSCSTLRGLDGHLGAIPQNALIARV